MMRAPIHYVVVNFFTPDHKHYSCYEIHTYSDKFGSKEAATRYCHKLRQQKTYRNNPNYKWYVMTEEQAREHEKKLRAWKLEEERKILERRFPTRRYVGQTWKEELNEMMTKR